MTLFGFTDNSNQEGKLISISANIGEFQNHKTHSSISLQTVIPIQQDKFPTSEWDENDVLLGGAFPHLFLLGNGLPKGSMKQSFLNHCSKYYNGRFKDPMWIATAFNQLQHHTCIRQTAKVGMKNARQVKILGTLANSKLFQEKLKWAANNAEDNQAVAMN